MEFVDVFLRQAHPGEDRPGYQTYAEKVEAARRYKREEALPWTLLVDDFAGTVHRAYSEEMADPVFLIDSEGIISFYGMWTHVPTLHGAIETLLANGGRGVSGGLDRTPHLLASFVDGYRGPRRGGRRAVLEYDLGALGAGTMSFAGNKAKSVLGPLALRSTPLPETTQIALGLGACAGLAAVAWAVAANRREKAAAQRVVTKG